MRPAKPERGGRFEPEFERGNHTTELIEQVEQRVERFEGTGDITRGGNRYR